MISRPICKAGHLVANTPVAWWAKMTGCEVSELRFLSCSCKSVFYYTTEEFSTERDEAARALHGSRCLRRHSSYNHTISVNNILRRVSRDKRKTCPRLQSSVRKPLRRGFFGICVVNCFILQYTSKFSRVINL